MMIFFSLVRLPSSSHDWLVLYRKFHFRFIEAMFDVRLLLNYTRASNKHLLLTSDFFLLHTYLKVSIPIMDTAIEYTQEKSFNITCADFSFHFSSVSLLIRLNKIRYWKKQNEANLLFQAYEMKTSLTLYYEIFTIWWFFTSPCGKQL